MTSEQPPPNVPGEPRAQQPEIDVEQLKAGFAKLTTAIASASRTMRVSALLGLAYNDSTENRAKLVDQLHALDDDLLQRATTAATLLVEHIVGERDRRQAGA